MIKRLLPKSDFSRNVLTLATGTSISQAIYILITPVLTRLYSPENFGVVALFIAVTTVLGSVSSARYELAIMLPEKDEDAINIAVLCFLIATVLSLAIFVSILLYKNDIVLLLGNEHFDGWIYVIPLVIWMIGVFNIQNYLNTRKKNYSQISRANIHKSLGVTGVQTGLGVIHASVGGLIIGHIVSHVLVNYRLAKHTFSSFSLADVSASNIIKIAVRYKDFPRYILAATLSNNVAQHVVILIGSIFYDPSFLGVYALVQRALGLPSSVVGGAVSNVFYQEIANLDKHNIRAEFYKLFRKLAAVSVIIFIPMYLFIDDIFIYVFGDEWALAGGFAKILIPFFAIRFVVSPLARVNQVLEKQKLILSWQLILLAVTFTVVYFSGYCEFTFEQLLGWYVVAASSCYLVYFILMRRELA